VKRSFNIFIAALLCFAFMAKPSQAQDKSVITTRVLFMFDASFSMFETWQKHPKIDIAKYVLTEIVDSLKTIPHLQMALRTFGADYSLYPKRNCEDTRLLVPFADNTANDIEYKIKSIQPRGTTPIAYSLGKCADDFTPCENCRNVIILITDGIEECGGEPCDVSKELQKKGIILRPFIIGIGNQDFSNAYSCVGKFFNVKQEEDFSSIMKVVISQALNNTTAQINLLDAGGKPLETDVAMTLYDQESGRRMYNFMHTINDAGNPDTIVIDPNFTYHLVVHTIPEVEKKDITVTSGVHNIIAVKAAQGFLHIVMDGDNEYKSLNALIRKSEDMKTLNVQIVESTEKYLVGKYDLEILTLPRINLEGIKVSQSTTTTVSIPQAGLANISKPVPGPGSIYVDNKGKMEWVCNLASNPLQYNIVLQPGIYRVVYRPLNAKQTIYTVDKKFEIKSGSSTTVKID
jgi:Ca-activated chloride channel family protein